MMEIDRNRHLFELTVGEYIDMMESILNTADKKEEYGEDSDKPKLEYGIAGIARIFNCSISTANRIKASGKIDKAILQRGRLIVIDVNKAIELFGEAKSRKS